MEANKIMIQIGFFLTKCKRMINTVLRPSTLQIVFLGKISGTPVIPQEQNKCCPLTDTVDIIKMLWRVI